MNKKNKFSISINIILIFVILLPSCRKELQNESIPNPASFNIPVRIISPKNSLLREEFKTQYVNIELNIDNMYHYVITNDKKLMLISNSSFEITFPRRNQDNPNKISNIFIAIKYDTISNNKDEYKAIFIECINNNKNNISQRQFPYFSINSDTIKTNIPEKEFKNKFRAFKGVFIQKNIEEIVIDYQYPMFSMIFFNRIEISGYNKNFSLFFEPIIDTMGVVKGFIK